MGVGAGQRMARHDIAGVGGVPAETGTGGRREWCGGVWQLKLLHHSSRETRAYYTIQTSTLGPGFYCPMSCYALNPMDRRTKRGLASVQRRRDKLQRDRIK